MTFSWRSYIDALSAKFNECIARHSRQKVSCVPQIISAAGSFRASNTRIQAFPMAVHRRALGGNVRQSRVGGLLSHLPAANAEQEPNNIGLLLLLDLFDVLEGTHLDNCESAIRTQWLNVVRGGNNHTLSASSSVGRLSQLQEKFKREEKRIVCGTLVINRVSVISQSRLCDPLLTNPGLQCLRCLLPDFFRIVSDLVDIYARGGNLETLE